MESVTLTKPWLTFAAGDTVEVDLLRALWLRENGYATAKRPAAAELELRPIEPELQSPFPGVEILPPPASEDEIPPGHMVSPRVRKALMSKLREPVTDLKTNPED